MKPKKVVVTLPAFNEAATIRGVLEGIPSHIRSIPVSTVVVDDGSTDGTAEIAASCGVFVVRHLINLGVGAATQTGLRAAQKLDADIIVDALLGTGARPPLGGLYKTVIESLDESTYT